MKEISIVDGNKTRVVSVIRYLRYKRTKLLLFTDSIEEKNTRIKIAKVTKELGFIKLTDIKNKYEWLNTKSLINLVVREIFKGKIKSFVELDPKELTGIKMVSYNTLNISLKSFKVLAGEDKDALEPIDKTMMNIKPFIPECSNEKNYKELYEASQKENHSNKELIKALMEELDKYREKYGELE